MENEENVSDSYTFIRPDDNIEWWIQNDVFEIGHAIQVSESCNPNFIDHFGNSCDDVSKFAKSKCFLQPVRSFIYLGQWNTNGYLETYLVK